MSIDRRIGRRPAEFSQRDRATLRLDTGPYVGVIKNNVDPLRKGRLQVFIPDFGGDENEVQNWITVNYASPFIGSTSSPTNKDSSNSSNKTANHTYGMWFVPPDIDNQVLVTFVAGDPNRGYWFACISPHASHYMIPGVAATSNWDDGDAYNELPSDVTKQTENGKPYPTLEFNENDTKQREPGYIDKNSRPLHQIQFKRLVEQGLENDTIRGTHSSSSQREAPSSVFGISTPGQPAWSDGKRQELKAKLTSGELTENDLLVEARQGGHIFVMDDGTLDGKDQLIKLRTSGGHQIVMNDSGRTLYISNSTGSVWIELSDSGNLHIYSNQGLNVRSEGTINFHSDADINLNALGNIYMKAKDQIKTESQELHMSSVKNTKLYSSNVEMLGENQIRAQAEGGVLLNSGDPISKPGTLSLYKLNNTKFNDSTQTWKEEENSMLSIVDVLPTHEPFSRRTGVSLSGGVGGNSLNTYAGKTSPATTFSNYSSSNDSVTTEDGSVVVDGSGNPVRVGSSKGLTKSIGGANLGVRSAVGQPISKKLSPSALAQQPTPGGGIGDLSTNDVKAAMAQIGHRESTGNYDAVNQFGYLGKYQFGAAALVDRGYIKLEAYRQYGNAALARPDAWTGKDNIKTRDDFLRNTQIQENVMYEQMNANYNSLLKIKAISPTEDKSTIAGMLSVAHLLGPGGAKTWRETGTGQDANGTGGGEYFNLGRYSVEVLSKGA